jgi:hypothetical protein
MAIKKLASQYGVVELNKLASVRTGEIEAQYALDAAVTQVENGMLLVVDHIAKTVKKPVDATSAVLLHASVEKDYQELGRKNFVVKQGEFLPRLYKLKVGDRFETNCVEHDDAVYANYAAIVAANNATTVYGVPNASGNIRIVATPAGTEAVQLKVVEGVTLPNGESGLKFVVVKA